VRSILVRFTLLAISFLSPPILGFGSPVHAGLIKTTSEQKGNEQSEDTWLNHPPVSQQSLVGNDSSNSARGKTENDSNSRAGNPKPTQDLSPVLVQLFEFTLHHAQDSKKNAFAASCPTSRPSSYGGSPFPSPNDFPAPGDQDPLPERTPLPPNGGQGSGGTSGGNFNSQTQTAAPAKWVEIPPVDLVYFHFVSSRHLCPERKASPLFRPPR